MKKKRDFRVFSGRLQGQLHGRGGDRGAGQNPLYYFSTLNDHNFFVITPICDPKDVSESWRSVVS